MTAAAEQGVLTLSKFLLARIAEDEEAARILQAKYDADELRVPAALVNALALVDPTRVLAECEAKRRIVEIHTGNGYGNDQWDGACDRPDPGTCPTLLELATVYASHPDYREEWKP